MANPQIVLPEFTVMFCPICMEPLRPAWPKGAGLAAVGMFNAFLEDVRTRSLIAGDVERAPAAMIRVKPVCEWLGRTKSSEVIQAALDGKCYGHKGPPPIPDPGPPSP